MTLNIIADPDMLYTSWFADGRNLEMDAASGRALRPRWCRGFEGAALQYAARSEGGLDVRSTFCLIAYV